MSMFDAWLIALTVRRILFLHQLINGQWYTHNAENYTFNNVIEHRMFVNILRKKKYFEIALHNIHLVRIQKKSED